MRTLARDVRHGWRLFARNPGFTAVAVLSIALGTGANTAMFSAADGLVLRPLPIAHPNELLRVGADIAAGDFRRLLASYPDYQDLRERSTSFASLTAFSRFAAGIAMARGAPVQVKTGMAVSANFFDVVGVPPVLGRAFLAEEDRVPGRDAVTVLSHDLWQQLGADPAILGRTLRISGIEFQVIGVTPPNFVGPDRNYRVAFYVPMMMRPRVGGDPEILKKRELLTIAVRGRLKPEITRARAQAELDHLSRDLERAYPESNRNRRLLVRTELESMLLENRVYTGVAAILSVLAAGVLVVACANVAGLLASRAPLRAREIALRQAIGAGRFRLIRQLLTESLMIAVAGTLLGLPLAWVGISLLRQIQFPSDLLYVPEIVLNERALVFSLAIAILSTVLFGLLPSIQTTRADLTTALKTAGAQPRSSGHLWGRNFLVGAQVAISLVLLTVAAFVYDAAGGELRGAMGFRANRLLMMTVNPALAHYSRADTERFFERLLERVRRTAGVKSATVSTTIPIGFVNTIWIAPEGYRFPFGKTSANSYSGNVDESYFETFGIPIVRGRGFLSTDGTDAPPVAVVNEVLAARYWPGQNPVGKRFRLDEPGSPWIEVVGVARTSRYLFIGEPPTDFVYLPFRQHPVWDMTLTAQSTGDSASLIAPLREAVRSLDPDVPVYDIHTMENYFEARAARIVRVLLAIVGGMGVMGMALAMAGLYGLMSYMVARRTREIGIRMAVGAGRATVLRGVLAQGLVPAAAGVLAGLALSAGTGRLLAASFPLSAQIRPALYGTLAPILLLVAALAAFVPAHYASRIDPMAALREE